VPASTRALPSTRTYSGPSRPSLSDWGSFHIRASTEPVLSTRVMERYGVPRLSVRACTSAAKKVERRLTPGRKSRAQNLSFAIGLRGDPF